MDFFKCFFSPKVIRSYLGGAWTSVYPESVTEKQLLDNNKEWVFLAVDKVANAVSAVRFKVMRYDGKNDDQEVFTGPMVDFLEQPGKGYTGKDFIYLDTVYKELVGNAFWKLEPGNKLKPLVPTVVRPNITEDGRLIGYKVQDRKAERTVALKDMLHDRYIDPRKPYWGAGKLERIARWVDTSSYANEFLRTLFTNGAQFGGFIETEEESEERIKLIKLGLINDHVGVEKAHKWAVLPKGSKATPNTANLQSLQFQEMDEAYRDKILAACGVPKTLVGFTTEVSRASAEARRNI